MSNKGQTISEDVKALRDSLQGLARSDDEVAEFMAKRKMVDVSSDLNYELKDGGKFTLENFRGKDKESYLASLRENRAICFLGESRAGKTHIASALCRESAKWGLRTKKIKSFDFRGEVRLLTYDNARTARIDSLKNCDVLFFDDIGKGDIFKNETHNEFGLTLLEIFEARSNKINICTAGFYNQIDVYKYLGKELFGRIFHDGHCEFFELKKGEV